MRKLFIFFIFLDMLIAYIYASGFFGTFNIELEIWYLAAALMLFLASMYMKFMDDIRRMDQ